AREQKNEDREPWRAAGGLAEGHVTTAIVLIRPLRAPAVARIALRRECVRLGAEPCRTQRLVVLRSQGGRRPNVYLHVVLVAGLLDDACCGFGLVVPAEKQHHVALAHERIGGREGREGTESVGLRFTREELHRVRRASELPAHGYEARTVRPI